MKKTVCLHSILLNARGRQPSVNCKFFTHGFNGVSKKIFLMFIAFFGMISFSFAQSFVSNVTSVKGKRDLSEKLKTIKKETREEKRSTRAVEDISSTTKNLFASDFSSAKNVAWSAPEGFDEADFTLKGKKMMAFFDFDSKLMGTGKYVMYSSLPAKGRKEIMKRYKGYVPEKIMYYDDNESNDNNMDIYGAPMEVDSYYALMKKNNKEIVIQVTPEGEVSYFSNL